LFAELKSPLVNPKLSVFGILDRSSAGDAVRALFASDLGPGLDLEELEFESEGEFIFKEEVIETVSMF
jgi:hypothetical protein